MARVAAVCNRPAQVRAARAHAPAETAESGVAGISSGGMYPVKGSAVSSGPHDVTGGSWSKVVVSAQCADTSVYCDTVLRVLVCQQPNGHVLVCLVGA